MRTPTKPTTCTNCHAPILTGPDADRAAITRNIDPNPINRETEMLCIIANRQLYELDRDKRLYPRPPRRALNHKPLSLTIHAEHICHQPLPTQSPTPRPNTPDQPPF